MTARSRSRLTIADLVGLVVGYGVVLGWLPKILPQMPNRDGLILVIATTLVLNGFVLAQLGMGRLDTESGMAPFETLVMISHLIAWFGSSMVLPLVRLIESESPQSLFSVVLYSCLLLAMLTTTFSLVYLACLSTLVLLISIAKVRPILGSWVATAVVILIHLEVGLSLMIIWS